MTKKKIHYLDLYLSLLSLDCKTARKRLHTKPHIWRIPYFTSGWNIKRLVYWAREVHARRQECLVTTTCYSINRYPRISALDEHKNSSTIHSFRFKNDWGWLFHDPSFLCWGNKYEIVMVSQLCFVNWSTFASSSRNDLIDCNFLSGKMVICIGNWRKQWVRSLFSLYVAEFPGSCIDRSLNCGLGTVTTPTRFKDNSCRPSGHL